VVAAKRGPNVEDNPSLRAVVDKALAANMKRDTIEKAIVRGSGTGDDSNYEAVTYEGYGVSGVAVLAECLTDNRNRTVAEVRHAFTKCGGNLGTDGSVAYLFSRRGQLSYGADSDEDQIMEAALEAGAEDVLIDDDGSIDVVSVFEEFLVVKEAMATAGFPAKNAEILMVPDTTVSLGESNAEKLMALVDMLEDLDDVQNVYTNVDIAENILAQF
jgi:YebC/PmpR family DNA-binding regulatory protein